MHPTVAWRYHDGAVEILDRFTAGGERALCVFWSPKHGRRNLYAKGCYPEDGWEAVGRAADEMKRVLGLVTEINGTRWVYVEPAPPNCGAS